MRLASSGIAAADGIGGEPLRHKLLQHLVAHLKAVLADACAHHRHDARAVGTQSFHRLHRASGNFAHRATPTSVCHAQNASLGIGKRNIHAVGSVHPNAHPTEASDQRIYGLQTLHALGVGQSHQRIIHHSHVAGVRLARHHQAVGTDAEGGTQRIAASLHMGEVVGGVVAEIHFAVRVVVVGAATERVQRNDARHFVGPLQNIE